MGPSSSKSPNLAFAVLFRFRWFYTFSYVLHDLPISILSRIIVSSHSAAVGTGSKYKLTITFTEKAVAECISDEALSHLKTYQYSSVDNSLISKYILGPYVRPPQTSPQCASRLRHHCTPHVKGGEEDRRKSPESELTLDRSGRPLSMSFRYGWLLTWLPFWVSASFWPTLSSWRFSFPT